MARYAVILKETGEVSDVKLMEGDMLPEINTDAADKYEVAKVGPGVAIGMVRGGPVHSADGFGFPEGYTGPAPAGGGVTRVADAGGRAADDRKPVSHEKQRGAASGSGDDGTYMGADAAEAEARPAFDDMTVEQLRDYARENEISLHGASTKADIIKELRKAEKAAA